MKSPLSTASPGKSPASIQWGGERLQLLPERALWWERVKTLFIADPHFGKASAFRSAGIPVPESSHTSDLARLEHILQRTAAIRLIVLGDFFHAQAGRSPATLAALAAWRKRHSRLEVVLILGNHDRHAGVPPDEWEIQSVESPWSLSPYHCFHEPPEIWEGFALAGHLHPAFHLSERIGSGLRGPCFSFGKNVAILPAFGSFTGTHRLKSKPGDRIFMVGPGEVIEVTHPGRNSSLP